MKNGVTILLVLILALTTASSNALKVAPFCQKSCNCRAIYKPVCGKTGRTHANACFATCAGDVVLKKGACPTKCLNPKPVHKTKCAWIRYGKNGRRNHCCSWKELNGLKMKRKCKYSGPGHWTFKLKKCSLKKVKGGERLVCCTRVKKIVGRRVSYGKPTCKGTGPLITKRVTKGCGFKKVKGYTAKYCCTHRHTCKHNNGRKRCSKKSRCKRVSNFWKAVVKNKCGYTRPNKSGVRYRKCCSGVFRCFKGLKNGKRVCQGRSMKCRKTGHKLKSMKSCNWRTVGENGRRRRCCKFQHYCPPGKKCEVRGRKCYWAGCLKRSVLKGSCSWKQRTKHVSQRLCCTYVQSCSCGKCHRSKKKCVWKGSKVVVVSHRKCNWKILGKHSKRKQCCDYKKTCFKGKCEKTKRCKWASKRITITHLRKCVWTKITKNTRRRRCCTRKKRCEGNKCSLSRPKCKLFGYILYQQHGKNCQKVKQEDGCFRLRCCGFTKSCTIYKNGKKKCSVKTRKCRITGRRKWWFKKTKTIWRKYKGLSTRRWRCNWTRYCVGNKRNCVPIGKKCKWIGLIRQTYQNTKCKITKIDKNTRQERCCTTLRRCKCSKLGDKSNCVIRRTRCKWVGEKLTIKHKRGCLRVPYKGGIRTKCCTKTKRCKGSDCRTTIHSCKYIGPCTRIQKKRSCKMAPFAKGEREQCCSYVRTCVGRKCGKWKKTTCQWQGKCITRRKHTTCAVKRVGNHKQKVCCTKLVHREDGKIVKESNRKCLVRGPKVPITRVVYRRKYTKKSHKCYTKYCTLLYKCTRVGDKKEKCRFKKKIRCKTVNKIRTYKKTVCGVHKYQTKKQKCQIKRCTQTTFVVVGVKAPKVKSRRRYNQGKAKCTDIVKKVVKVCTSAGDPHIRPFSKKKFNFYKRGDYLMYKTASIELHARTKKWGRTSVNTAVAARLNNVDVVESLSVNPNAWIVNKKDIIYLKKGVAYPLKNGGYLKMTKDNLVEMRSADDDIVYVYFYKRSKGEQPGFLNIVVVPQNLKGSDTGLCVNKSYTKVARGLFRKCAGSHDAPKGEACKQDQLETALDVCKQAGVKEDDLEDCAIDVCNDVPAGAEVELEKEVEKVQKTKKKEGKK